MQSKTRTNKLVVISILSAMAYAIMVVGRVPMIAFLKYDPKDIVFMLGGMAFGPLATVAMSVGVSVIEFMTVSSDGPIGLLMNILATVSFVTTATIIYRKNYSTLNLVVGLIAGSLLTTLVMVAWNYIVTPWFLGIPRPEVVKMLVPVIIPFNLIKSAINSAIIIIIHEPALRVFKSSNLIQREVASEKSSTYLIAGLVIISSIILVVMINNINM